MPARAADCGPIPIISDGTGPAFGATTVGIGNNVKVDNGNAVVAYTSGTTTTNRVLPAAGGNTATQAVTLPGLSPETFPATSGSFAVASNGSGALASPPYTLNALTVGDGGTLTLAPGDYFIGSITVGKNATLRVGPAGGVRLYTSGNASFDLGTRVNPSPDTGNAAGFVLFVYGARTVDIGKNVYWTGVVYAPDSGSRIDVGLNALITGGLVTGGALDVTGETNFVYTPAVQAQLAGLSTCTPPPSSLHHLQLEHPSGSGLTCTPTTLTVRACQDAACNTAYTGGVSGTLSSAGGTVAWPSGASFTIGAGASTTTLPAQLTTVGTTVFGATASSPAATNPTTCNFGAPACTYSAADSGLLFSVTDHAAETAVAMSVSAVRKSDSGLQCVPAFASTTKPVTFRCAYADPASGALPVRVGLRALNAANDAAAACDATGQAVSLAFDASGVAATTLQYADVGRMTVSASYAGSAATGDAGLAMTGSAGFIAAPASFAFSAITPEPIRAGSAFSATVAARNAAAAATPNFGREATPEGVTLGFVRASPTGAGAANGSFTGSVGAFANGSATGSNLTWSEVGSGDLTATLASGSYLGTGLTASGSTGASGAVGRFIPHHFDVEVLEACLGTTPFTYAGQPFSATVHARNAVGGTTLNYDGTGATTPNHARAVTLSDPAPLGVGTLSGSSVAAAAFSAGQASATPSYAYTSKLTGPRMLTVRAVDTDGVSSAGAVEDSTPLRSGRLRLANAFGSATQPLQLTVLAEYWSGSAWVRNSADNGAAGCTTLPAAAVAVSNSRDWRGAGAAVATSASTGAFASGQATLTLAAPTPAASGVTFDLALNLGTTATDQSCQPNHPATTGAARAWLRSANGACAVTYDRDPSARATFGIYSPETRKTVHVRELY